MASAIKLPDMGTNVEECKLLSWLVKEGDPVKRGQVLAEIETDKATAELESTAEGVLLRQVIKAGETASTGDILAYVGQPGEVIKAAVTTAGVGGGPMFPAARTQAAPSAQAGVGGPARVAPVVRNLAAKLGVDLARVQGTGAGGTITREDVLRASQAAPATAVAPAGESLTRGQAAVARAVLQSWKEIPHYYIDATIDMTAAQRIRAEGEKKGRRPSFDAIFLKALAKALQAFPRVAAKLQGGHVVQPSGIHLGFMIGAGDELFMPVIRDADRKNLDAIQTEIADLAVKVRAGTLKAEHMTGSCMALSNLGMYSIEGFRAVIFPEHSTILALGAVQKKPVVVEDRVEIRPMVTATLGVDHRLINGRTAAEFLSKMKQIIESGDLA